MPRKAPSKAPAAPATPALESANVTAEPPEACFPIVGIGASAGGLAAFEAFFSGMPANAEPGMAFVLVQHLAPDHKSILTELIRRYTRMQVFEVEDGMTVRPNCTYIIPPNRDMAFFNGTLQLLEPLALRGQRLPIDYFFRSLEQDQRERAIGIVLSGTGSDGTLGVRSIKGEGGMVMVQSTASSEFNGMPQSAIATGLVDYQLPPADMPAQLIAYAAHAFGNALQSASRSTPLAENALKKIFILLRSQTGHDFSQYKPNTIQRRIERRLAVHQIPLLDHYVKYLQQTPTEVDALFRDLLIGVTNFFRDPDAFHALEEQVIPHLFDDKPAGSAIRVWSAGCSTGEEAYSIAILLQERQEALKQSYTLQVFATDIDSRAIATARAGLYPTSIAADISPERLARFFSAEQDGSGYRINKGIRDILVFSEQDVLKDPPFSKIDLISCRNLMIYLGAELQKKLFRLFHYALNPGARLFLGTSESMGDADDLFAVLDRKAKLYQRKEGLHGTHRAPASQRPPPSPSPLSSEALPRIGGKPVQLAKPDLRQLTEQALLLQVAPAAALVNAKGDILYLHGRTGKYLELAPGVVGINNILKMAREGLARDLSVALHEAAATKDTVCVPGIEVKTNGDFTTVVLTVAPLAIDAPATSDLQLFLVVLKESPPLDRPSAQELDSAGGAPAGASGSDVDMRIEALKQELRAKEDFLQTTNEELETSNEELKSSNEELQSLNEELQSTNEELETAKEELQSVNEELSTVNTELQIKVVDLSRANNDMNNLLAGTGIATVFVDQQLRILRFTPSATEIINLILSDLGRPVGHIVSNLVGYENLLEDAQAVLDTLIPKEIDLQSKAGKWYTMRILPYRTLDNVIEGVVITFVEITEVVRARVALRDANELLRLAVVVRDAHDAITVQDLNGRMLAWNPGAVRMYGWSEAEALLMNVRDRIPDGLRERALSLIRQLSLAEVLEPYSTQRITKAGTVVDVWMTATALVDDAGKMYAIATTERTKAAKDGQLTEPRNG